MEDIKEKLKKPEFINWVRATLGLQQTKKAIEDYVKEKFRLYTHGKASLQHYQTPFTEQERNHITVLGHHMRLDLKSAVCRNKYSGVLKWNTSDYYNCAECKGAFEKIMSLRRKTFNGDIHYQNSDSTMKISLEWAIAKLFMPKLIGTNNGPEDTDSYAMFHMMGICTLFLNAIRETHMVKLLKVRNSLCHSSDNEVTDQVLTTYFQHMIDLLKDASNDIEMDKAIRDKIYADIQGIEEFKKSDLSMTLVNDADKALKLKSKAIFDDFETSLHDNNPEELRKLLPLVEQVGGDIQGLKEVDESRSNQILVHIDKLTEIQLEAASVHVGVKNLNKLDENNQAEILKISNDMKIKIENLRLLWEENATNQRKKDGDEPYPADDDQPSVVHNIQYMGMFITVLAAIAFAVFLGLFI